MKIKTNWVIYFALLPFWQKALLSLAPSIIVSLLCYLFRLFGLSAGHKRATTAY